MKRLLSLLLLVPTTVSIAAAERSGCEWVLTEHFVDGAIQVTGSWHCPASSTDGTTVQTGSQTDAPPPDSGWDPVCVRTALSMGLSPEEYCDPLAEALPTDAPPTVTPGMVATAFQELPLPASELVVQPPDGRTLVNFATNFFTDSGPFTESVTLLGQRVDLRIWPARFTWVFGDGATQTSAEPGAPYPALDVTHEYLRKGRVSPRVDTTYAAEFRVNGGAWAPVAGTVTIPGEPVGLVVETATPVLVAYE
ncbi:hypothetical protein [Nocardioides ferulae]|uniref:hypothetical protein n=1 Tax=Nocardioides ferulae TaxID=2340821 RepID=UPI000EAECA00|nr:hypothetical protein [Nocardioides ferulae]